MPSVAISYQTECGVTLHEGDRAYDYYSMKPGHIGRALGDGWFDFEHDDGTIRALNGQRICSLATAALRDFPGAFAAMVR